MMRRLGLLCSVAWLAACGPQEATAGTGESEDSGSSTVTTTATDGGSTPTTMDPTVATASASGGSSTGGMPGDSSGDGPMPTTTTPGDTGPSDSSGGSDGTGGGMAGSYPPCQLDADPVCPEPLTCQAPMGGQYNWCSMGCKDASECPLPSDGDAVPFCGGPNDVCMLDCADGATCPTGMECVGLGMNGQAMRCVWAAGI